jgi:hypothetical protein
MAAKTLPALRVPKTALLPDKGAWTNRFEVRSSSSNRIYVIAQNKSGRHWGCSCPGWCNRRSCKHLIALNLPAFEKPYEAALQAV